MRATLTTDQLAEIPEELLKIDNVDPLGPMELTGAYYVRGHEEGHEQGRLVEARRVLLRVLDRRGITVDELQRRRIETCDGLARLELWLDRALLVTEAALLFE